LEEYYKKIGEIFMQMLNFADDIAMDENEEDLNAKKKINDTCKEYYKKIN